MRIQKKEENVKIFWRDLVSGKFARMVGESSEGENLHSSADAYNMLKPITMGHPDIEKMYGIYLDRKNKIIGFSVLASGTLSASAVYPREVIKECLSKQAAAIILAHNHPSQDTTPSLEDQRLTRDLTMSLRLVGIDLLDHIIIGNGYFSFADDGRIKSFLADYDSIFTHWRQ
ncbi:MAG: JAB domain-containing protein [Pseudomonadota bacterium]|uniref:Putative DNA repair protein n=1 Tax=viral metagenome TaxID=1070528 RepID=A0A6H1ZIJ7_9ZZZZ